MLVALPYGCEAIQVRVPDDAIVYRSHFPEPPCPAPELVRAAAESPAGAPPLADALKRRRQGDVVVVVSDVTRPVPYSAFLGELLAAIEAAGVPRREIVILVATGLHRPTTDDEKRRMLGERVSGNYRIIDHRADDAASLAALPKPSWSGASVKLNRRYLDAGFRLITGLVEPHFMAGFSGGRKAICPGLASIETVRNFHGAEFLASPLARNGNLAGNPLHEESLSVARQARPDFSLNVVLDGRRRVVAAFAGELEAAHAGAAEYVRARACPTVEREADLVLTSSGGHPLDATFYQCVKGFVSCLPAVKPSGTIIAVGSCCEGVGSAEYAATMRRYAGRWRQFLDDIRSAKVFTKDQWQFQMHARALARVGAANLHFVTGGLDAETLGWLSVVGHSVRGGSVAECVQELLDREAMRGRTVGVIPEGPYCAPVGASNS